MPLNIEVTQFPNGVGDAADNSILNGVGSPLNSNGSVSIEDFSGGENYLDHYSNVAIGGAAVASVQPNASGVVRFTTPGVATQGSALEADGATTHVDGFFVSAEERPSCGHCQQRHQPDQVYGLALGWTG